MRVRVLVEIGPFGRRHSDLDLRSRSLCRRLKGLIFPVKPSVPVSIFLVYGSKVRKKYYYYKFKMQNRRKYKQDQPAYSQKLIKLKLRFIICASWLCICVAVRKYR